MAMENSIKHMAEEIRMFGMFRVAIPGACGMICLTQCLALLIKCFNSLAPGRCGCDLQLIIFNLILRLAIVSISFKIVRAQVNATTHY